MGDTARSDFSLKSAYIEEVTFALDETVSSSLGYFFNEGEKLCFFY